MRPSFCTFSTVFSAQFVREATVFLLSTLFVDLKTEFLDTCRFFFKKRYSGFEVSKISSLALITLFAPFSALSSVYSTCNYHKKV